MVMLLGRCLVIKRIVNPRHKDIWLHWMARSKVDGEEVKHEVERYCARSVAVWSSLMIPFAMVVGEVEEGELVTLVLRGVFYKPLECLTPVMIMLSPFMIFI